MLKKTNKQKTMMTLFAFSIIFLTLVSVIRMIKEHTYMDTETYYYMQNIRTGDHFSPLSFLSTLQNPEPLIYVTPILLGIFSLFIFYRILLLLELKNQEVIFSMILIILSPSFINTFTSFKTITFIMPLALLFFQSIIKNKHLTSALMVLSVSLFNFLASIPLFLVLTFFVLKSGQSKLKKISLSLLTLLVLIAEYFVLFQNDKPLKFLINDPKFMVSEFGFYTISTFAIILAIIGFFSLLLKKKANLPLLTLSGVTILFLFTSLVLTDTIHIFALFIYLYAGLGAYQIYNHNWDLKLLKTLTIMLLFYGILFSALSSSTMMISSPPGEWEKQSLKIFNSMDYPKAKVLSTPKNGFLIQSELNMPVMLDEYDYYPYDNEKLSEDINTIFYSRDLDQTSVILKNQGIRYIYITPSMKNGEVWTKNDEGLLFILGHSSDFNKILEYRGVEIWRYNR